MTAIARTFEVPIAPGYPAAPSKVTPDRPKQAMTDISDLVKLARTFDVPIEELWDFGEQ
ncbi:hypothetical protein QT972_05390 [Microcoleus sp. herbarium7]|uniref:hypothetical protein n=1 Tax=Microcoleus sp. herbarium13 TaxID=3055438 RepID=UPI002FD667CA